MVWNERAKKRERQREREGGEGERQIGSTKGTDWEIEIGTKTGTSGEKREKEKRPGKKTKERVNEEAKRKVLSGSFLRLRSQTPGPRYFQAADAF